MLVLKLFLLPKCVDSINSWAKHFALWLLNAQLTCLQLCLSAFWYWWGGGFIWTCFAQSRCLELTLMSEVRVNQNGTFVTRKSKVMSSNMPKAYRWTSKSCWVIFETCYFRNTHRKWEFNAWCSKMQQPFSSSSKYSVFCIINLNIINF